MTIRTFMMMMILLTLLAPAARADVVVFAAASLKEPLDALTAEHENVVVSYGGSGTLARQVGLGAPVDIVLLANAEWMDILVQGDHVRADTVADIASNRLVLIGPADAGDVLLHGYGMASALGDGRIAVGLTEAVPAGIYAKAALMNLNLWEPLSWRLAEVDNVRAAMALVARGQAPLGIVYETDARVSDAVRVVARFPADAHPPIRYIGALTTEAGDDAAAFWSVITGAEGQAAFAKAGFLPPTDRAE